MFLNVIQNDSYSFNFNDFIIFHSIKIFNLLSITDYYQKHYKSFPQNFWTLYIDVFIHLLLQTLLQIWE